MGSVDYYTSLEDVPVRLVPSLLRGLVGGAALLMTSTGVVKNYLASHGPHAKVGDARWSGRGYLSNDSLKPKSDLENPFKPAQGVSAIIVQMGPHLGMSWRYPTIFELVIPFDKSVSCIFVYGLLTVVDFPTGFSGSVGVTYGTKMTSGPLAVPTGSPVDIVQGHLLCYPAGSTLIEEALSSCDKLLGYDPTKSLQGAIRRVVVSVVEELGQAKRAHGYFELLPRAAAPTSGLDGVVLRVMFSMKQWQAANPSPKQGMVDSWEQAAILYYFLVHILELEQEEVDVVVGVVEFSRLLTKDDLHNRQQALDREVHCWIKFNDKIYDPSRRYDYLKKKRYYNSWKTFQTDSKYKGRPTISDVEAEQQHRYFLGMREKIKTFDMANFQQMFAAGGYGDEVISTHEFLDDKFDQNAEIYLTLYGKIP
eukprot:gb/GEZN01009326.1/.p1 GENE.gb/GEZN01009326.1/~~gb/GEZN01009326.1/.p1  ORF type:complete len:442 (-),score=72.11 gb/GEZN01009326.1/:11-1276(-)